MDVKGGTTDGNHATEVGRELDEGSGIYPAIRTGSKINGRFNIVV
jgi:hypothetical protein